MGWCARGGRTCWRAAAWAPRLLTMRKGVFQHPRHIPELDEEGEMVVHADVHLQTPNQKHRAAHQNEPSKPAQGVEFKVKLLQPASLNIFFLFLVSVLVLSSCYMAFKIVALEKRLNSLGSAPKTLCITDRRVTSMQKYVGSCLQTFKLEKIQRHLRKLLEET
ncbi:hypothetical protein J4Q44_G00239420 [Coregonus suidteri]|uniref:Uncharacterized protein n=1 Tax=Coregonus suidteri TaxID=861788 RepID=A0AAN8L4X4_9TELE